MNRNNCAEIFQSADDVAFEMKVGLTRMSEVAEKAA